MLDKATNKKEDDLPEEPSQNLQLQKIKIINDIDYKNF